MRLSVRLASRYRVKKELLEQAVARVIKGHGLTGNVEVSVSLVDDKKMTQLNRKYMGKLGTTDVLSFPLDKEPGPDGAVRLGDVVVSFPEATRQANERGVGVDESLRFLTEHGVLHLLGVHHD